MVNAGIDDKTCIVFTSAMFGIFCFLIPIVSFRRNYKNGFGNLVWIMVAAVAVSVIIIYLLPSSIGRPLFVSTEDLSETQLFCTMFIANVVADFYIFIFDEDKKTRMINKYLYFHSKTESGNEYKMRKVISLILKELLQDEENVEYLREFHKKYETYFSVFGDRLVEIISSERDLKKLNSYKKKKKWNDPLFQNAINEALKNMVII
jgi:hypothetical protein